MQIQTKSTLTCPICKYKKEETMPMDVCWATVPINVKMWRVIKAIGG